MLGGCSRRAQPPVEETAESIGKRMIHIDNFTVTDEALALDYTVSNPFEYDIWVCEDIDINGTYDVETRISPGTLNIRLCFNLECNVYLYALVFAKYRLLKPGQSHSGKILLDLPVKNASPVYHFAKDRTELRRITSNRAVFEVGYLKGEVIDRFLEIQRLIRLNDPSAKKSVDWPEIKEETIGEQSQKFALTPHVWSDGLTKEKSAKVVITDIEIPCLD